MTLSELIAKFPESESIPDRVLLVGPAKFRNLNNLSVSECRIFMLVTNGGVSLKNGSRLTRVESNHFIDMLVWEPISFLDISEDIEAWCLFPNYQFTNESLNGLKPTDSESFKDRHAIPLLSLSSVETDILKRQLSLLGDALENTAHYYRNELCRTYFRSFMLETGNITHSHSRNPYETESVENRQDTILRSFLKLVWRYYKTEHRIDFYAERLCISSKHLARVVKARLGKTPYAVIRDEILQRAISQLKDSKMSVQEIAAELHFSEMAAFCKFFKKHTGMAPTTFRAQSRSSALY